MAIPDKIIAFKQEQDIVLHARVYLYIYKHPDGVEMKELETEFLESRARLDYIVNKLIAEGKIQRAHLYPHILGKHDLK